MNDRIRQPGVVVLPNHTRRIIHRQTYSTIQSTKKKNENNDVHGSSQIRDPRPDDNITLTLRALRQRSVLLQRRSVSVPEGYPSVWHLAILVVIYHGVVLCLAAFLSRCSWVDSSPAIQIIPENAQKSVSAIRSLGPGSALGVSDQYR
ncbi:hypothetical protein BaRGS_00014954 [Batillaria attramentaria]|uniref:Uncharacterized protein n=1 Tax=Batillaria attramentaria TaxID=370345 RepID=A0ABD0L3B7_9CAEN